MAEQRLCSISGCHKRHLARGWCAAHHSMWLRHGDPNYKRQKKLCSVSGCGKRHVAHGLCMMHYARVRAKGSTELRPTGRLEFVQEALRSDSEECILWPFPGVQFGYGRMRLRGKTISVHRYVCIQAHGSPPPDKPHAAHYCGNRLCVNHRHLRWASSLENAADRKIHGTERYGNKVHSTKLTEDNVREIRAVNRSIPLAVLARRFGVTSNAIAEILSGNTWKWLK